MTDDPVPQEGIERRVWGFWRSMAPIWVLFAWAVVAPLLILAFTTIGHANNRPDVCYGLGFGCVPDALTSAIFLTLLLVAPVLVGVLLIVAIASALRASMRLRLWIAALGPPVAWLVIAIVALV